ncbi:SymE family type I addiction module toxin [Thalassomonas actiniarum]|uniref:Type I toxin-antitoxin system SymE family toxin n=1 Tax=Thalassomonas actiniarum TaxID=485447 RepID=A0AAE9YUX8_9GAMM|nr:SymE family type I addiction module toxin [Thalassomonas actiniarum]WDE00819.1 type I toxin-antitoxin system SymE family toxin [Thalassomonas actiniarum]
MAESNHTSEPRPAKVKYPASRQLTVLETICENAAKTRGVGLNYVPVTLEPYIVLRGKWLTQAGFAVGQKVTVTANQDELVITPTPASPEPAAKA